MSIKERTLSFQDENMSSQEKNEKMSPQGSTRSVKDNKNAFPDDKLSFQGTLNKSSKPSVVSNSDIAKHKGMHRPSPSRKGKKTPTQLSETAVSKQENSPNNQPGLYSHKPSVEEYFAEGMERYRLELELEAKERARLGSAEKGWPPARTPSFGLLGDVLDRQLRNLVMITRACQTDWKWMRMAVRWRHARIIDSSHPPPRVTAAIEYDLDTIPVSSTVSFKQQVNVIQDHASKIRVKRSKAGSLAVHQPRFKDKCVDTRDLAFDHRLRYPSTNARKSSGKFHTLRGSSVILRWRDIARSAILSQKVMRQMQSLTKISAHKVRSGISQQQIGERPEAENPVVLQVQRGGGGGAPAQTALHGDGLGGREGFETRGATGQGEQQPEEITEREHHRE